MKLRDALDGAACLVRTGWMQRGVPPSLGETVAVHSFWAALIALELGNKLKERGVDVDPERASAIALAHDLQEVLVGDIPKWSADRMEGKKEALELEALEQMNSLRVARYAKEYIELRSKEAYLAKLSETLATLWMAEKYIKMGLERVNEIKEGMERGLEKVLKEIRERWPEMGKKLEEVLADEGL